MIDILVTTFNRLDFLKQTVESLIEKNKEIPFRLFVIDDCSTDGTPEYLLDLQKRRTVDIFLNGERRGLAFSLDMIWNCSEMFDGFFTENPYLCYLQDDMRSVGDEWLLKVVGAYEAMKVRFPLGFFSGYHSPEHPIEQVEKLDEGNVFIKKSNSGKNMIGEKTFWRSIGYVPKFNPDGSPRGMPDKGRGSHVDVYFEGYFSGSKFNSNAAAPNCLHRQGKKILVVPGMLEHMGEDSQFSTWQKDRK